MGLKDLLSKAGSLLVEDDGKPDPKKETPKEKKSVFDTSTADLNSLNARQTVTPTYTPTLIGSSNSQPTAEEMANFFAYFEDLMNKANLPGPDYFEFAKMVTAMGALDEPTRFNSAYLALQVQGITKEQLISTANQYLTLLESDRSNYENAVQTKLGGNVQQLKNEIDIKRKEIAQKEDLIRQLQGDINTANDLITKNSESITEQEGKIAAKLTGYRVALEAKKSQISTDVTKINQYIR